MKKYQKGFTIINFIQLIFGLLWIAVVGFLGYAVVYAIGKYLFHWWG